MISQEVTLQSPTFKITSEKEKQDLIDHRRKLWWGIKSANQSPKRLTNPISLQIEQMFNPNMMHPQPAKWESEVWSHIKSRASKKRGTKKLNNTYIKELKYFWWQNN